MRYHQLRAWRARYRSLHVGGLARLRCRAGGVVGRLLCQAGGAAGWRVRRRGCDAREHKCHLCSRSASELKTGTDHFLVAARVEFGTGNRHGPFFGRCPRGVQLLRVVGRTRRRAVAPMPGKWCGRGGGFDARQVVWQEGRSSEFFGPL